MKCYKAVWCSLEMDSEKGVLSVFKIFYMPPLVLQALILN